MYEKLKFDLARNSLKYLINEFDIKELYLPYYLCEVIRHAVVSQKCKPIFYHINDLFMPETKFDKNDYILYPNYFGICEENVNELEKLYPKLIVDNAHSLYSPPHGIASFNAIHKFSNNESGSYLFIKRGTSIIDYQINHVPEERLYEFKKLHSKFASRNNIKINIDAVICPFCYPFLASTDGEADELAENLTREGKIIYRYWNNLPKDYNEYKFYRRLVPIPF